jgi:hypothetical protein
MNSDTPLGLRYLVEHGHAADGSHGENTEPTQQLVNPAVHNPTSSAQVREWIARRVEADDQMRRAHARGQSS